MTIEKALVVDLRGSIPLDTGRADAVVSAGFSAILINVQQLDGDAAAFRRMAARAGLTGLTVHLEQHEAHMLDRAEAFGASGVVVQAAGFEKLRSVSLAAAELGLSFAVCPEDRSDLERRVLGGEGLADLPLFLATDRMLAEGRRPADFRGFQPGDLGLLQLTDQHLRGLQQGAQALPGLGHLTLAPLVALLARKAP